MLWLTSDLHFHHKNIIEYCKRPFNDVDHMNESLIYNWNSVVLPGDEVLVLGDVVFGNKSKFKILERLEGEITVVLGNHDRQTEKVWNDIGWKVMPQGKFRQIAAGGIRDVFVSHFPWHDEVVEDDRYIDKRLKRQDGFLLHGHVHCAWRNKNSMINVGSDVWNYTPVQWEVLCDLMREHAVYGL